ncbi:hypothetical protein FNF31_03953 [Cafeteria roenbergensis]|uniref:Uncharacterized protein n=1 Tax=Cafeteria roenbergensis TaxID=33653 RepID=A0A5A8D6H3_CAFRO|nr:hypothetical protein FNF31_03953 [Cafeteria roenbergensis]
MAARGGTAVADVPGTHPRLVSCDDGKLHLSGEEAAAFPWPQLASAGIADVFSHEVAIAGATRAGLRCLLEFWVVRKATTGQPIALREQAVMAYLADIPPGRLPQLAAAASASGMHGVAAIASAAADVAWIGMRAPGHGDGLGRSEGRRWARCRQGLPGRLA